MDCPCKGCTTDRCASCHSTCKKYIAWKERKDSMNAKIKKARYYDSILCSKNVCIDSAYLA